MERIQIQGEGHAVWNRKLRKVSDNEGGFIVTIPVEVVRYLEIEPKDIVEMVVKIEDGKKVLILKRAEQ
jgi:bifunctional DNA-binding transcriptional regulator/antitoxin component of YhaV-PrlF toxin-antitoxin module